MRVRVDLNVCQGYGNCVAAAADVFDLDDRGLVMLLDDSPSDDRAGDVLQAASLCPVQAITVEEAPVR